MNVVDYLFEASNGEKQMELKQAIQELRKSDKRNFSQSFDLLISLKGIDVKKDNITTVVSIPNKVKDKKVCAFLSKRTEIVKTVTNLEFPKYKDAKELKRLVKNFDFFIAEAKLMPSVATAFGKALGPTGKMPSPQLGVLMSSDDNSIKQLLAKIDNSIKVRVREPAIKLSIGNEKMSDEQIISNVMAVYTGVVASLPTKKENIKSIMLKLTMSKPIKVEIK